MKLRTLALSTLALALALRADEGMWTLDNLPVKQLQGKYGFTPDKAWMDHLRLASLNWGGGSGSFISADGLVLTNHHIGRGSVERVSTKENDYLTKGFVAKTRAEELRIPNLSIRTLAHMEPVTEKVATLLKAEVKPGMDAKAIQKAKDKVLAGLAAEAGKQTGLSCQAVSFYEGGEYWIYGYQVHTDVRLVAAPELQMAMFGGNDDNFTYLRHALDFCLFRVYGKDGQPYKPAHYLKWSTEPLKAGDLTFVSGHPGRTSRAWTHAQMVFEGEKSAPLTLLSQKRQLEVMDAYGAESPEQFRAITNRRLGLENSWKAGEGYLTGLKNKAYMASIAKQEKELRDAVAKQPALKAEVGQAWTRIEQLLKAREGWYQESFFINSLGNTPVGQALAVMRYLEESAKPASKRSAGYENDENLKLARARIEGNAPSFFGPPNPELDRRFFIATLNLMKARGFSAQHPLSQAFLSQGSPEATAKKILQESKLSDPAARKALLDGGLKAIAESTDPAVVAMRKLAPLAAKVRQAQEAYNATLNAQAALIAKARFQVYGRNTYPDANGTLRLSYGVVEGYVAGGTRLPPFTTFAGLYDRHWGWGGNSGKPEAELWKLPQRWLDGRSKIDLTTPLNFVHSVDIIGGNSGSPTVNRKGELVGLIFDGNYEGLPGRYYYDDKLNRAISVDARGIVEALNTVMDAGHVAKEILGQ